MPRERKLPGGMWKRGNVYYARYRSDGALIRKRLSSNVAVAKEMLEDLMRGTYRAAMGEITNDRDFKSLFAEWQRSNAQRLESNTVRRYEQNIGNLARLLSVKVVSQLGLDVIEAFREDRLHEGVEPRTINSDVGALSTMLGWAVERGKLGSNPIAGLKPLPEEPREVRALTGEEVSRLLKHAGAHWHDIWYAFLTTGLRKMEVADLLFTDIDWPAQELIVRSGSAKNKTSRRVPIDDRLFQIICHQRDEAESRRPGSWQDARTTELIQARCSRRHVFVTTANTPLGGNLYRAFMASCKRAKIEVETLDANEKIVEVVDLHSTRHTFATDLIQNGADPRTVQALLGHKTLEMTMRIYAKVFATNKHSAIGKLSYGAGITSKSVSISISRSA